MFPEPNRNSSKELKEIKAKLKSKIREYYFYDGFTCFDSGRVTSERIYGKFQTREDCASQENHTGGQIMEPEDEVRDELSVPLRLDLDNARFGYFRSG